MVPHLVCILKARAFRPGMVYSTKLIFIVPIAGASVPKPKP